MTKPGKDARKVSDGEIIETKMHDLFVKLTPEEQVARGKALAQTLNDIASEQSRQDSLKATMKSEMARLEAERDRLSLVVGRGEELRPVEVDEIRNLFKGVFQRIRKDNGEVIQERTLTPEERQASAF